MVLSSSLPFRQYCRVCRLDRPGKGPGKIKLMLTDEMMSRVGLRPNIVLDIAAAVTCYAADVRAVASRRVDAPRILSSTDLSNTDPPLDKREP